MRYCNTYRIGVSLFYSRESLRCAYSGPGKSHARAHDGWKNRAIIQLCAASILRVTTSKKTAMVAKFGIEKRKRQMLCQLCFFMQASATPPTFRQHVTLTFVQVAG